MYIKKFILALCLFFTTIIVNAGNDNPTPCNCNGDDKENLYAAGEAHWITGYQIECLGQTGTCWSLTYNGKWILTIYTDPVIVFDNHNGPDDPPVAPYEITRRGNAIVYQVDDKVWK